MSSTPSRVDVKAFIDERAMSPAQWLLLALCFLVVAADGMDVAIMGFLAPSILQEWHASRPQFGMVMSAAPIGLVLGALIAGPASDRVGRKTVLTVSVLLFGIFTALTSLTENLTQMAALRLLTGLGLGAAMPNASTLLSEYVPQRSRSLLIAIMFTGFNLGSGLVGFGAAYLIPLHGWRSVQQAAARRPRRSPPCWAAWAARRSPRTPSSSRPSPSSRPRRRSACCSRRATA
jgi:AAHS family 4-hydroxybenzoate transporter-like MFS transporter